MKNEVDLENHKIIKSPQKNKLLDNAEEVIELIENGKSYRFIANNYQVRLENIYWFVNHSAHSMRARQALELSSYECLEQAEEAIEAIDASDSPATVRKQVEKMNIAIYKAKIKNRKTFDLNFREQETATNNNIITPQLTLKVVNQDQKITIESE